MNARATIIIRIALAAALALGALASSGCSAESEPESLAATGETAEVAIEEAAETEPEPEVEPQPEEVAEPEAEPEAEEAPQEAAPAETEAEPPAPLSYRDVPVYEGNPYVYINDGEPAFDDIEKAASAGTERYDDWDELGRCTYTFAVVGPETMPTEKRGDIGEVRPSGWQMAKYDFVEGKYLYNRCHLLGYQLTGENANLNNLITGTRYLNVQGMLPFENAVADYVGATGNHVLMRVTPIFEGPELVARGVHMMAESVEDGGEGVSFNVFCYNVQPGVVIDYGTGESMPEEEATPLPSVKGDDGSSEADAAAADAAAGATASEKGNAAADESKGTAEYVLNTNTRKFHVPSCSSVKQMKDKNRQDVTDTRDNIIAQGFEPCKRCNP